VACRYPRDPDDTLGAVIARGSVSVAVAEHPPWVSFSDGSPRGVEVGLIERLAGELGVAVAWLRLPAPLALAALGSGEADLAAGGFTREEVEADGSAAPSLVYHEEAIVVAAQSGEPLPGDLDGARVFVPPDVVAEGRIRRLGGLPVSDPDEAAFAALPHWRLAALGLAPTGIVLERRQHVIAVPKGENAWLMGLETVLREAAPDIDRLLQEAAG
jgi:polar amino acid transport system substrate-binding protein